MESNRVRDNCTVRIIRDGKDRPDDSVWKTMSVTERVEAVWTLTRLCMAWNTDPNHEPRLQRSVSRIQRPTR
ncbi:MAG: hypothetical protein HOP29_07355 [Phycisphaerales bacterium]|nr:hypothetical protein [Phycisphaerales bacterium]